MNFHGIRFIVIIILLVVFVGCKEDHISEETKPNIILVMADDQGWGDMAYTGNPWAITPNFDDAAQSGLRFDRFYAAAPVCSPTRASILTGRNPNRTGVYQWGHRLRPQEETIAELLKQVGYATGHFGKWHLGSVRKDSPVNPGQNGFDYWASAPNYFDLDPILSVNGTAKHFEGESSDVTVRTAIEWIDEQAAKKQPFLALVWFGSPHDPHIASDENLSLYDSVDWQAKFPEESDEQIERRKNFLGEITGMDTAFGELRDHLTEIGIRDNTILWYISDNGALPNVGSTGGFKGNKGSVYEGGLLVPGILEWPNVVTEPRSTSVRANTTDIFPTLLELAGVSGHAFPLDGTSLGPLIKQRGDPTARGMGFWHRAVNGKLVYADSLMNELLDEQHEGREPSAFPDDFEAGALPDPPVVKGTYEGSAAWIDGDWKLVRKERQNEVALELYNLDVDPFEQIDLAVVEPERVEAMHAALKDWLDSVVDSINGMDYSNPGR